MLFESLHDQVSVQSDMSIGGFMTPPQLALFLQFATRSVPIGSRCAVARTLSRL
jgi:hypothetical protein